MARRFGWCLPRGTSRHGSSGEVPATHARRMLALCLAWALLGVHVATPTHVDLAREPVAISAMASAGSGSVTTTSSTSRTSTPSVLIIVADDLGVDKVGAYWLDADPDYGSEAAALPQTPILDQLAASGLRFTDAWASPSCSPSRASLQTGLYPFRHGVGAPVGLGGSETLDVDSTTIGTLASDEGYETALFGEWHLGEGELPEGWSEGETFDDHLDETVSATLPPTQLGWQSFLGTLGGMSERGGDTYHDWTRLTVRSSSPDEATATRVEDYATLATTEDALDWISDRRGSWLAMVNYHAPHTPLEAPPADCTYTGGADGPDATDLVVYQAMVECLDHQIGELLDGVPHLDNTLVIFLGDNGTDADLAEAAFDDGRGKATPYESGVRVPFIITDGADYLTDIGDTGTSAAGRHSKTVDEVTAPGSVARKPVHVLDVFATVADVIDATVPEETDSVSLLPLMRGGHRTARDHLYSEMYTERKGSAAFRDGPEKLVVQVEAQGGKTCRQPPELYDLATDRFESHDLAPGDPTRVGEMVDEVEALHATEGSTWLDVPDC